MQITLTLNGIRVSEEIAPDMLLIDFVRAHGCKSVKRGCETSNCGLCTVFLDEMNREYLRTAAAKGATPFSIYFRHLLRNAMIPILTRASTVLPFLFTGSLLLETFFGIPGLGYEGINALNDADLQMLKALVILSAFLFVVINLITDLLYAWVDPRVRVTR